MIEETRNLIGSFPKDEPVLGVKMFEGDLLVLTTKALYRIPAKTLPFLGVYPIKDWGPFLLRPSL